MLYADNANHLGLDPGTVNRRRELLSEALNSRGLATHEVVEASDLVESLGMCIDGTNGVIRLTDKRYARLYGCLRLLSTGQTSMSGRELECVVGHITFLLLLNRPLLSTLNYCYVSLLRTTVPRHLFGPQ